MVKEIPLKAGLVVIIDDDDFEYLSQFKWYAHHSHRSWYAERKIHNNGITTNIQMHRLILKLPPKYPLVDHINHNGLDNRKENLRTCDNFQNMRHSRITCARKYHKTSKYKGVSYYNETRRKKKWCARIYVDGKDINLGYYINEIEAALVYDKAAKKYYGEFAVTNFKDLTIDNLCATLEKLQSSRLKI